MLGLVVGWLREQSPVILPHAELELPSARLALHLVVVVLVLGALVAEADLLGVAISTGAWKLGEEGCLFDHLFFVFAADGDFIVSDLDFHLNSHGVLLG